MLILCGTILYTFSGLLVIWFVGGAASPELGRQLMVSLAVAAKHTCPWIACSSTATNHIQLLTMPEYPFRCLYACTASNALVLLLCLIRNYVTITGHLDDPVDGHAPGLLLYDGVEMLQGSH